MEFIISNAPQIVVCIIICMAKILEISIQSIRVVFLVKGAKVAASILAFIECMIWGVIISAILSSLGNNIAWLISYCGGYALGIFIGSFIESKIAIGTSCIQIMVNSQNASKVIEFLEENKKGFTALEGHGSKEAMTVIIMIVSRKESHKFMSEIRKICNNEVFVTSSDINKSLGGYGLRK